MCYVWMAGGSAPSTPGHGYGATPRRFGPAVNATAAGPLAGRHECRAAPACLPMMP